MADHVTPNLPSRDFDVTEAFYAKLGFATSWKDRGWMILQRGGRCSSNFCIMDTEGYWKAKCIRPVVAGGFVQVGDDDDPSGEGWSALMEYREDGSIVYQVGGIEGDVLFEEASHD